VASELLGAQQGDEEIDEEHDGGGACDEGFHGSEPFAEFRVKGGQAEEAQGQPGEPEVGHATTLRPGMTADQSTLGGRP
jgi:hypothetical protein